MIGATRYSLEKFILWSPCYSKNDYCTQKCHFPVNVELWTRLKCSTMKNHSSTGNQEWYESISMRNNTKQSGFKNLSWEILATPVDLHEEPFGVPQEESSDAGVDIVPEDVPEGVLPQKLNADEIKSLLADSERSKLINKLSEANQYNRFLKRELQFKEDALVGCKSELAAIELELQDLIGLAEEISDSAIQDGLRKINGKDILSYLISRLEAFQTRMKEQTKGVEAANYRDVELFWFGMAEIVQVMGSFDGWSQGEHLSPEYTGEFNKFSATLKLKPGKYEIKFLVDGEWQLSPELPVVGEGMMRNNLLIVE